MRFMTREPGLEPHHVVNGFPWDDLGEATVVDLGGSHGAISVALARKYPSLKLIVQVRVPCHATAIDGTDCRILDLTSSRTSTKPSSEKQRLVHLPRLPIGYISWSTTS